MKSNFDEDGVISQIMSKEDERIEEEERTERPPPSGQTEKHSVDQEDDQLIKTAKSQMGEVREENQRLKKLITNIAKDYQSLQTHFFKIMKQDHHQEEEQEGGHPPPLSQQVKHEAHDLVSLSLGRSNSGNVVVPKKEETVKIDSNGSSGLSLALDGKLEADLPVPVKSPGSQNSVGETKEGDPTETWSPSKTKNNVRGGDDNEGLQQSHMKKARVSVRARCDAPTMHDGCQWRKYGQKIAKGNPCPRAYYRCTISPNCPVRKQVQRCVDDMTILITTYEGTHNHPLPMSATAMASTTSAAASMLTSRSSTSQQQGGASSFSAPISASTTNALHFPHNTTIRPHHQFPYYFPTTSISNHNSHPTVTLDLTAPTNPASSSHHFSNNKFSQTCLDFSSPPPPHHPTSASWANNYATNYSSLGSKQPSIGQEHYYNQPSNSFLQLMNNAHQQKQPAQFTAEAITAATKAIIASNPTIRNALTAAITSFVGNNGSSISTSTNIPGFGDHTSTGLNLKLGQSMAYSSSNVQNAGVACGPSYFNKPTPGFGSHQQVNLGLFPSSSPLASSRSDSGSPASSRDHVK